MKPRAQKTLGITLLVGAPVAAGVLYLLGVRLFSVDVDSLSGKAGSGWAGGWVAHLSIHWSSLVLILAALLGLWLLTRSKHEKPGA